MTMTEKQSCYQAIYPRYQQASRKEKTQLLDEYCQVCDYQRKYAIRKLKQKPRTGKKKKRGCRPLYQEPAILKVIKTIWLASDQMCSKHLIAALPEWLPHYEQHYDGLDEPAKEKVLTISASTVNRLLKPIRIKNQKGLSGTRPGTLLKNQIPIRTGYWDVSVPGFMEADTVAHCGNSLAGDFV